MRTPCDRLVDSPKNAMLVWYAALITERDHWGLDETDADSLVVLSDSTPIQNKSLSGEPITFVVTQAERVDWLQHYRVRLALHASVGVSRAVLGRRMDYVLWGIKLVGANRHYAGYETHFRKRLLKLLGCEKVEEVSDEAWHQEVVRQEVANYMAYTDYYARHCGFPEEVEGNTSC